MFSRIQELDVVSPAQNSRKAIAKEYRQQLTDKQNRRLTSVQRKRTGIDHPMSYYKRQQKTCLQA